MVSLGHSRMTRNISTPAPSGVIGIGLGAAASGGVETGGGATTGGTATGGIDIGGGIGIGGGTGMGGGIGARAGTAMATPAPATPARVPAFARRTSAGVMLPAERGAVVGI